MNGITIENKGKQHKIRRKLDNNVTSTENQGKHHTIHKKLGTQRNIHRKLGKTPYDTQKTRNTTQHPHVTSTENQGKHHTIHKKLGTQRNIHTIQETAMQNPQKAIENNVKIHMIDPYKQA